MDGSVAIPPIDSALTETVHVDGEPSEACFTADGSIQWRGISVGGQWDGHLSVERDVLGFEQEGGGRVLRVRAVVQEESRAGICSCVTGGQGEGTLVRKDFMLEMPTVDAAATWAVSLRRYIDCLGRPRRLFILLNPYGGKKCARKIFDEEIEPLLTAAEIHCTIEETQYHGHAQALAMTLDLSKYDGVICVSGDGVPAEVLNGLLKREDWESAIKMPMGIIPAGTGNGMAKSLLDSVGESCSVRNAVLTVIRGKKSALDVATIQQGDTSFFSMLMLSWGLVADVDIESEKYRWLGSARFDFYLFVRLMKLRTYSGQISFVPAPGYESLGDQLEQKSYREILSLGDDAVQLRGYQGPKYDLHTHKWRFIDGPFILIWLHNVPWASYDVMPAPSAKFSDGYYDLTIIKDCPRLALFELLSKLKDGTHVKSPYVTYVKVKAFYLEPGQQTNNSLYGGIIDCDGEVLARGNGAYGSEKGNDIMRYGPISLQVHQGLATIFSPVKFYDQPRTSECGKP